MMLDMASIEIISQPFDPPQLIAHAVIKDSFLNFLIIDNSPYFLFMNQVLKTHAKCSVKKIGKTILESCSIFHYGVFSQTD